ncbi:MAG: SusC/RagA family TonB-linked outer membrane protein [Cruoricaptor ignavus]|nr:SusC/RagA family TonB-linked outer membrane protein [Cruoricaptor ignavus]
MKTTKHYHKIPISLFFLLGANLFQAQEKDKEKDIETVVITGYQKVKNRVFTGAASSVKMKDIQMDGVADLSQMLEGRVPGLNIKNVSGTFGAAPRINIRGGASITGNVQPLWVIDGAVYEDIVTLSLDQLASGDAVTLISSAISGINPSDIEDVQVLKDAAATSIYGARALNGVIVISTKNGKRNSPLKISYSYEQSFRTIPTYNEYDLLNSQQTMSIYQEMERKGYFDITKSLYGRRGGIYYQMYNAINTINPETGQFYLPNTEEARTEFLRKREYANTNWFKQLYNVAPTQNHMISITGGGEKMASYASLGFYSDPGWTIADKVSRITANLKNTFYINDKIKASVNLQGNTRSQTTPGTFSRRRNTAVGSFERDFDINPFLYALGTSRTLMPKDENGNLEYYRNNWAPFNILNEYQNNYMEVNVLDFKIQGELEYKINPNLTSNFLAVARNATTNTSHYVKENSNAILAFRANENALVAAENIYLVKDPDNPLAQPQVGLPYGGMFNKTETSLTSYLVRASLDYEKRFGEHDLKLFGFTEMRHADRTTNPFQGYGIQYDRGGKVFTNPLIFDKILTEGLDYFNLLMRYDRGVSFSGNATYGYKGKYILNAILNYEGSNISGKSSRSRWLPTWNVGGKWNMDKEDFISNSNFISKLSLRASYGLTAKMNEQAINSLAVYQSLVTDRFYFQDRENEINILHLENQDLTWEKMYEMNVGLDFGLFNNRISTTLDVYSRQSFDLIDLVRTSGVGGQYYKYANFGDMSTKGVELSLTTKNIQSENFSWTTNFTAGLLKQKITRLLNTPNTFDMVAGMGRGNLVGYARGSLFSFDFQGLDGNGLPYFNFGDYPLYDMPYANVAGADFSDTQFSKSYLKYHGPVEPNFTGGFSNTFKYKGLELSFYVTFQAGNKIRLQPTFDPSFMDLNVFSQNYYDRWLVPGDELRTNVPVIPSQDLIRLVGAENIERAYNTYNYSQMRVADGSFVRMKNISLGYQLPKDFTKQFGVNSASVRIQATNPFLIYSDKALRGQDPEFYKSGGVSSPIQKQYTLSLSIGF